MGAFVLGILVGWLAEWLFYTFWVKAGEDGDDCSALKAELELKNRQISSLQSQLNSVSDSTKNKAELLSTSSSSSQETTKTSAAKLAGKPASKNKTSLKENSSKSIAAKSPATRKASAKISTKPVVTKPKLIKTKASGDDFTKLSGIGPSMSATLKTLGIDTFQKLAETDDDILRDMLEASGARMNNNKEAMDSWNEQATVAAKGDFKALKAMQVALKR